MNITLIALSLLIGVVALQTFESLPAVHYLFIAPFLLGLAWRIRSIRYFAISGLGFLWALSQAHSVLHPALEPAMEGKDIFLTARIDRIHRDNADYKRFIVTTVHAEHDKQVVQLPKKLLIAWMHPDLRVRAGQVWRFTVRLKRPWGYANPGSFDKEKWLFIQAIGATGYVRKKPAPQLLEEVPRYSLNAWQSKVADDIQDALGDRRNLGVVQGLAMGLRGKVQEAQWDVLRVTGTSHLLAISGLHIGAVAFFFYWVASLFVRVSPSLCQRFSAQKIAVMVSLLAAVIYAGLAGFTVPTQRALIMVTVIAVAIFLRAQAFQLPVLMSALIIVLLWQPNAVLSSGFWLSFSAIAIIYFVSDRQQSASKWKSKIASLLKIQWSLSFALFPLTVAFFDQGSLISPVVNIFAVPYISFLVLPLILLAAILGVCGLSVSHDLWLSVDYLLEGFWIFLDGCSSLSFSSVELSPPPIAIALAIMGTLLLLMPRGTPLRWLSIFLIPVLAFADSSSLSSDDVRLTVLDVGQGLSVVVEMRDRTVVYDTGARFASGYSLAQAVVLPYLKTRNIHRVDKLVLSHNDNDHAGGAKAILEEVQVDQLLASFVEDEFTPKGALCRAGQAWQWGSVHFRFLHPGDAAERSKNNQSCVLQIAHPEGTILLTGDIEAPVERRLVKRYGERLASEVLLVPHHGSQSSSTSTFIRSVQADYALISSGYRNPYRMPHDKILARYQSIGIKVLNTQELGAITLTISQTQGIQLEPGYREVRRKYWHTRYRSDS